MLRLLPELALIAFVFAILSNPQAGFAPSHPAQAVFSQVSDALKAVPFQR